MEQDIIKGAKRLMIVNFVASRLIWLGRGLGLSMTSKFSGQINSYDCPFKVAEVRETYINFQLFHLLDSNIRDSLRFRKLT